MPAPLSVTMQPQLRSPTPAGAPIILPGGPRLPPTLSPTSAAGLVNGTGAPPPLVSPAEAGLFYSYDPYGLAAGSPTFLEYPGAHTTAAIDQSAVGTSYVR